MQGAGSADPSGRRLHWHDADECFLQYCGIESVSWVRGGTDWIVARLCCLHRGLPVQGEDHAAQITRDDPGDHRGHYGKRRRGQRDHIHSGRPRGGAFVRSVLRYDKHLHEDRHRQGLQRPDDHVLRPPDHSAHNGAVHQLGRGCSIHCCIAAVTQFAYDCPRGDRSGAAVPDVERLAEAY